MRPAIITVALAVTLAACGGGSPSPQVDKVAKRECEPTVGHLDQVAVAPSRTPSRVRLGPGMELERTPETIAAARRGRRFVVSGVIRGQDCAPLAGATLSVHQTNGAGLYGPGRDGRNRCCYLQGTVRTDAAGRYALDTVMPSGYDGGPSHIHFQAVHPDTDGVVSEMVFEDGGVPVERGDDGRLRATFDIVLRRQ
jgi:protocatechuate 3,4-dioxygenase beta subunit